MASSLEQEGFEVKIKDLTFFDQQQVDVERVRKEIIRLKPEAVGISSFTHTISTSYQLAEALKEENEGILVAVGGAHVSALPKRTLEECTAIDAVFIGEGEKVFPAFLKRYLVEETSEKMGKFRGVMYRQENRYVGDPNPIYIDDLDSLPFPARHLFDLNRYKKSSYYYYSKNYPVAQIITSRGCPHSCLFCTRVNNGYRFRSRTPKNVILELRQILDYGFKEAQICDDNFTENRKRVATLCKMIKEEGLNMSFSLDNGVRVDSVDEELLSDMYDAGFYLISFGAESGDDKVLEYNRKGTTVKQTKEAVRVAKKIGFQVKLFTVVGLPGSSIKSEKKTLQLIKESGADYAITSICTPYPGSPLWDMIKEQLKEFPWERYNEADPRNPLYIPNGMTASELLKFLPK